MKYFPKSASQVCIKEIINQTNNSFYKIYKEDGKTEIGTGFFCNIKYEKKNIPVIIINDLGIYEEDLYTIIIYKNNTKEEIKLGETKIKNKEFNIVVIEIIDNKSSEIHFMEIDDRIYQKDIELLFNNESLYIMQYSNIDNIQISPGVMSNILNNSEFEYLGNKDSIGSLIFNVSNNKIIGILYKNKSIYIDTGFFFQSVIIKFIIKYKHNKYHENEINILIKVEQEDINNKIYFLDNYGLGNKDSVVHNNKKRR